MTIEQRAALDEVPRHSIEQRAEERHNEVVREAAGKGISILHMMERELEDAWIAHDRLMRQGPESSQKTNVARGRIRGLAQAISLVRSPYSYMGMGATSAGWVKVIKATEDEAHARAKLRSRSS